MPGAEVLTIDRAPHEWLFPRMAAVVHHAGAGTTAAGLRAGVPAVPVPFVSDQHFWARRLVELGAAPRVLPARRLQADHLTAAIDAATTEARFGDSARAYAARLRDEDGAARVLAVVAVCLDGTP